MKTLGERIAFLRESKGLSQRQLMNALDIANLGRIEKNERKPGIDIIISLADYFEVSTDWLLRGKETDADVNGHHAEVSPSDIRLLAKYHQLGERDQIKIEERIEVLLELAGREPDSSSKQARSHISTNGNGEEAATKSA
ncbi:transcriptional regulator [Paenibacillus dendritiformis]|uniref:helix-turn-helix domain-containing protein n=1 Tax=Paenibacillus TaxID=44249 RepID=UPI001B13C767|nr:helix-turn-helix transcriptional regulator [Paenibacillus dendritiformis]GIO78546.1 transcriptional regulator [Paenibacillus dendritiformis]